MKVGALLCLHSNLPLTLISLVLNNTNSGGVTINDVFMHAGVPNAPFGGVGDSGYGAYHSVYGFLSFTHQRIVVAPPTWLDKVMSFRYPPYDPKHLGKLVVPHKQGFRPGESLTDQVLTNTSSVGRGVRYLKSLARLVMYVALARMIFQRWALVDEIRGLWQGVGAVVRSKVS